MIAEAGSHPVVVDLHPDRPEYRGIRGPPVVSWEADPSFEAIEAVGGKVETSGEVHEVLGGFFAVSGGIPRVTGYEGGLRRGVRFVSGGGGGEGEGRWESDEEIADERFVMSGADVAADKGIVMFTGCSHAGVVNASRHAVELGQGAPLYAVMGGYHLADGESELITKSVADLKALDPKLLIAGHCTGWRAKFRIQEEMPGRLVPSFVGNKLVL
ncbi:metallo-beta-lactamase superfamily protein [Teratosphaeria destructans]|uniref:Metallo-beta-lactamase superfamily protein n=1 Tax=Teratosphaeria destructans TaxID=418781 RepID=A0A9W7W2E0_9PEZI|nr:metallo-beta-lactamase superfamily protein [Teratosphaeria destructans]